MTGYSHCWICGDCKTRNEERLNKLQAAFLEARKIHRSWRCRNCGSQNVVNRAGSLPDPDDPEILQAWLSDKKLYFIEQDEELILAALQSSILVDLLSDDSTPRWRKGILFLALLVKAAGRDFAHDEDAQTAKRYLAEKRADWAQVKGIPFRIRKAVLAFIEEA